MNEIAMNAEEKLLTAKLLDHAYQGQRISIYAALLLSALIVLSLWGSVAHGMLLAWLAANVVIQLRHGFYLRSYMRIKHGVSIEVEKWERVFVTGAVIAGLGWGSTVFCFPVSPFDSVAVLVIFIIAGVTAFGCVSMAAVPSAVNAFLIAALLPLAIWLFSFNEQMFTVMSLMVAAHLAAMMFLSRQIYDMIRSQMSNASQNKVLKQIAHEIDQRMTHFFASAPGFFYTAHMSPDGVASMPFVSPGIFDLIGIPAEKVAHSLAPLLELIHPEDTPRLMGARHEALKNLTELHLEFRINHPQKGERWIELRSLPSRDPKVGTILHGYMNDITERKSMDSTLQRRETEFRALAENAPDPIYRYDRNCRRVYVNPAVAKLTGVPLEKMLGKSPNEFVPVPTVDSDTVQRCIQRVLDTGMPGELEVSFKAADGRDVIVHNNLVPEFDSEGNVESVLCIGRDITARKRMEEILLRSEHEYRSLAENLPDNIVRHDRDGRFRYLNKNLEAALGMPATYLLGKTPAEVFTDGSFDDIDAATRGVIASGQAADYYLTLPDSGAGERYHHMRIVPERDAQGEIIGTISIGRDITESKRMEQKLAAREREFRALAENLPVAVIRYDAEQHRRYLNPAAEKMLHGSAAELLGQVPGGGGVPSSPAMIEHYRGKMEESLTTGEARALEFVLDALPVAEQEYYEVRFTPEFGADGKPEGVLAIWYDITGRKNMERSLAASEDKHRTVFESANDGIFLHRIVERDGHTEFILHDLNQKGCELWGHSREDILSGNFDLLAMNNPPYSFEEATRRNLLAAAGEPQLFDWELKRGDGSKIWGEVNLRRIQIGGEAFLLSVMRDLSERKQAEEQLALLSHALDHADPAFMLEDGRIVYANESTCRSLGYGKDEIIGLEIEDIDPNVNPEMREQFMQVLCERGTNTFESDHKTKSGRTFPVEVSVTLLNFGGKSRMLSLARDITERKFAEQYEQCRSHILELLATDNTLQRILDEIVRGVEQLDPAMICSILLLDEEGKHLVAGAAPSLPDFYTAAVDGLEIGIGVGSCGTCAASGERVIVEDIQTHPYWAPFKELATKAGVGSCWSQPILSSSGKVLGTFAIYHRAAHSPSAQDISLIEKVANMVSIAIERKRMEAELRSTTEFQQTLLKGIRDAGTQMMVFESGRVVYANDPEFTAQLGYSAEEMAAQPPFIDMVHPDDRALVADIHRRRLAGEPVPSSYEIGVLMGDDSRREIDLTVTIIPDTTPVRVIAISRDITERKRMELALQASERDFRSLANNLPDNIARFDVDGRYLYINPTHERTLGAAASELIGKPLPATHEHVRAALAQVVASGQTVELVRQTVPVDGELQIHEVTLVPEFDEMGRVVSVLGMGRNMTEFYRMQDTIAAREQLMRTVVDATPDWIFIKDREHRYQLVNQGYANALHIAPEDFIGKTDLDLGFPEELVKGNPEKGIRGFWTDDRLVLDSNATQVFPDDPATIDGVVHTFHTIKVPLRDAGGKPWGVLAFARDITERKQAANYLEGMRARLQTVMDTIPDMIWLKDAQGVYLSCNQAFERLFGASEAEIVGKTDYDFVDAEQADFFRQKDVAAIAAGRICMNEENVIYADGGRQGVLETRKVPVLDHDGKVVGVLGVARDITERKNLESELLESRNFLNRIIDGIPDPIFVKDKEHRWVLGNEAFCKLLGQPREKLIGKSDYDFLPKEQADIFWDKDELVFNSGETNVNEEAITGGDGDTRYLQTKKTPFVSADGQALLVGVIRDITERKQAERQLKEALELSESVINAIPDLLFEVDRTGRYLNVWAQNQELLAAQKELLLGNTINEVLPPEAAAISMAAISEAEEKGLSLGKTICLTLPHGESWFELSVSRKTGGDAATSRFLTLSRDVTARKLAEEALREKEEKLSNLFALSPLGIALTDMSGKYIEFNEAFRRICGYPEDELMMLDYWTLTPRAYEAMESEQLESLAKTGRYGPYEKEYRQKNGNLIPIQLSGVLVLGRDGKEYIWSIVEDISERKRNELELQQNFKRISELNVHLEQNARDLEEQTVELEVSKEQLQQTEAWYRSILHSAPDGMLIVDSRGLIMQVNAQLEVMFGYYGGELPGLSIEVLIPEASRVGHVEKRNGFISSGDKERRMAGAAKDLFGRRKDGSVFPVDVSLSRLPDLDGRVGAICAAVRDVTERQKMDAAREAALSEALRLAQLRSAFMAQMSHELRTPLNGILGYTQNLLRGEALEESQRGGLKIIQHSGEHLLSIINGLLDHAAIEADKFELIPGDIELEAFLGAIIGMIRVRAEQKSIAFSCEAGDDLPAVVRGDAQRLRQVLLNLLSNAVKFTDKGQVILRVTSPAPARLRFEVQDSGVGIALNQLDNIFQPFEQVGEASRRAGGTGLGLSISRKLVGLMGGDIKVESQPGAGSVFSFEIEMPAVQSDAAKVNAAALSERAATGGAALASSLLAPPRQELDVLHALALRGNMRDVARQATHLAELDERYVPFAEYLRQLANGFQTKALLGFIAQYRDKKECE